MISCAALLAVALAAGEPEAPAPAPVPRPAVQETRVAVMPLPAGAALDAEAARGLTDAIAAEVARTPKLRVVTQSDIQAMLSLEKQKQLLGCTEDVACMAEIGGALGVERLLVPSVTKLGGTYLVHLKLIDVKKARVLALAEGRVKGAVDQILEQLPPLVDQLFPSRASEGRAAPPPLLTAVAPPPTAPPAPAAPEKSYSGANWMIGIGITIAVLGTLAVSARKISAAENGHVVKNGFDVYPNLDPSGAHSMNVASEVGIGGLVLGGIFIHVKF
jgi:TolB-like protein